VNDAEVAKQFDGRIHHPPSHATVLWDLLKPCNFSCSYCYSERLTIRPRSSKCSVETQLGAFADELRGWNVNLSGGEPMLHPNFLAIASGLVEQGNRLGLYTNLSRSQTTEAFIGSVDPAGVEFVNAGVHAQHRHDDPDLGLFARDFMLLANAGFAVHASYIIHPENVHRVRDDIDRLRDRGVRIRIQVFRGVFEGATYPAAFTAEELAFVAQWEAGLDRGRDVRVDFTGQGGSCLAGSVYMEMDPNGDCWRCGSYRSMRREAMGNLFERTLHINRGPERCRLWACLSCRQGHAFHLDGLSDLFSYQSSERGVDQP
jgi:MoaA/NifB/PqqE/SkfB family radical SAM enzyme